MLIQNIQPSRQTTWGLPAVLNFVLGGTAAGFYLLSFLAAIFSRDIHNASQRGELYLLAPVLMGAGFICVAAEAGRPSRGYHLFRQGRTSWMSREVLAGTIFLPVALLDWLFPHTMLWATGAAAALIFMISQGCIVYRSRAVPAWNVPIIPLLFVTSSFVAGAGLLLVTLGWSTIAPVQVVLLIICVISNLVVWLLYLRWSREVFFWETTQALRSPRALVFTVGVGHLFPLLFLVLILTSGPTGAVLDISRVALVLASLAMVTVSARQKADVILKTGYQRGITLEQ